MEQLKKEKIEHDVFMDVHREERQYQKKIESRTACIIRCLPTGGF